MRIRALTLVFLLLCGGSFAAQAQDPPRYTLKERQARTGSFIARDAVIWTIPLDKSYDQMTPEQKAIVRSDYVDMKPEDEPPFPDEGLGKMLEVMQEGTKKVRGGVRGELYLIVHVSSTGEVDSVEILRSPDERWGRFAAGVAMLTKYKPGICSGAPCAMEYGIRFRIGMR